MLIIVLDNPLNHSLSSLYFHIYMMLKFISWLKRKEYWLGPRKYNKLLSHKLWFSCQYAIENLNKQNIIWKEHHLCVQSEAKMNGEVYILGWAETKPTAKYTHLHCVFIDWTIGYYCDGSSPLSHIPFIDRIMK